jgi:2-octaprenylphenol hydroxylase
MSHYDIIIVGAGITGATAALALAKKIHLQIAVLDAAPLATQWDKNQGERRVSAVTPASRRIFQRLQIWDAMREMRISPYKKMRVWDAAGSGSLDFDSQEIQLAALGYIIEDDVMRKVLHDALRAQKNIHLFTPVELIKFEKKLKFHELTTQQHGNLQAQLVIAADGANSWIRTAAGIDLKMSDYQHHALVATVKTVLPHQQTARQRFLPGGPLAFLPLADAHSCSIVWSLAPDVAQELLALDEENFRQRLTAAFENELGEVTEISQRKSFPLHMRHARHYVQQGLALIGDAAHTIHPLAGQGVNMGLLDAVCLVDIVVAACEKNQDFAAYHRLRRFERSRKSDNLIMLTFVSALKSLFGSETKTLKHLRNSGLNLTNQLDFVKNFFVNYAVGNRPDLPELARIIC